MIFDYLKSGGSISIGGNNLSTIFSVNFTAMIVIISHVLTLSLLVSAALFALITFLAYPPFPTYLLGIFSSAKNIPFLGSTTGLVMSSLVIFWIIYSLIYKIIYSLFLWYVDAFARHHLEV